MSRQVPWARIVAEGVAIVVSILLAFGIQAWWEGVGEARTRDALLEGLRADFELAADRLEEEASIGRIVEGATDRWLRLRGSSELGSSLAPVADTLLSEMLYVTLYEPPMGAVEALINGGDMSILNDPRLARDLTAWVALLDTYQERERNAVAVYNDQIIPYLIESGISVADLVWVPEELRPDGYPVTPERTEAYRLIPDRRFQGIVSNLWFARFDIRVREERLRDLLARIRERLAA